jgi:uridine kinase
MSIAHSHTLPSLMQAVASCVAPAGARTRIVGIDGHGGAGKTTLAAVLADKLDAQVVHTDDFASWSNPVHWWPQLRATVLVPLVAGDAAAYEPTQWDDVRPDPIVIRPGGLVLLEGVTATRREFRPYLAYAIWVETPRELCLQRGLARDGDGAAAQWQSWLAEEVRYVRRQQPQHRADAIVDGSTPL